MNSVYLIAGASASGKSTVARELSSQFSLPLIHHDNVYNLLQHAVKDDAIRKEAAIAVCSELLRQLMLVARSCIVEGGWVNPQDASELFRTSAASSVVCCGFRNENLAERLAAIRTQSEHWLSERDDEFAMNWLQTQANDSESHYQSQCSQYSLRYVDFTNVSEGAEEVSMHFERWRSASIQA